MVPALRLELLQVLGELDAHQIVVGPEVGLPQAGVFLGQVGIDRHDRDLRRLPLQEIRHQRRIGRRDGDRGHALGQEVIDDLNLTGLVGAGRRPGVEAGVALPLVLGIPLLAAEIDLLEERVVEALDHDGQGLVLAQRGLRGDHQDGCTASPSSVFMVSLPCESRHQGRIAVSPGAESSEAADRRSRRLAVRDISDIIVAQRRRRAMPILECQGISKHFGAIHALDDVSLAISAGEVVGLMGDNGAGKSTLVKIVAGNFPPTAGKLFVDGQPDRLRAAVGGPRAAASRSSIRIWRSATTCRPPSTSSWAGSSRAGSGRCACSTSRR